MFLHEEIIEILAIAHREMTVSEIYKNIKHYRRRDGKFPPAYQIHAHIYDYPKYFYVNRNNKPFTIGLNEWRRNMLKNCSLEEIFEQKGKLIKKGLDNYIKIMSMLKDTDISMNTEFQETYQKFYVVRYHSEDFYINYFKYFENIKNTTDIELKTILQNISMFSGKLEMSFSSKIFHSINPNNPIWDSVVTKEHFGKQAPTKGDMCHRIIEAVEQYNTYKKEFYGYMHTAEGKEIITAFDTYFPNSGISNVKKVDFILWQDRKVVEEGKDYYNK